MSNIRIKLSNNKYFFYIYKNFKKVCRLFRKIKIGLMRSFSFFYWYIVKRKKLYNYLKIKHGIENIIPYKVLSWQIGYKYFLGKCYGKNIFIKQGGKFNLVRREVDSIKKLSCGRNINKHYPVIVTFDIEEPFKFIALEFIKGNSLKKIIRKELLSEKDKKSIILQMFQIMKQLKSKEMIHMDIRPDNFIVTKSHSEKIFIVLIDFTFSMLSRNDKLYEIERNKKNKAILFNLGSELNPEPLHWDDAYSFLLIFKQIDKEFKKKYPKMWRIINENIGRLYFRY